MNRQWKRYFKPWILERGREYYCDNRVGKLICTEKQIQASVEGSGEYCVDIQLSNGMPVDMFCDCPYADGGENCKHMAAVLFAVEAKEYAFEVDSEEEDNDSEYDSLWTDAIDQLPEQTLRELLKELAAEDEAFVKPEWLGEEVTGDVKYYNSMLMKNPYKNWAK